jgi:5-enolpyruvylshikimate-3-phosphate synthase
MRALLFSLMAKGTSTIKNYLHSPDTDCMIQAIQALGAKVEKNETSLQVEGTGGALQKPVRPIECGNSGQVLRFIAALGSLSSHPITFQGDRSIEKLRLTKPLLDALEQLGCRVTASPLTVQGPLQSGFAQFSGLDSQPVSALLMAASFLPKPTQLLITDPHEQPWVDLTLYWLKRFGAKVRHQDHRHYHIDGNLAIDGFDVTIPADFSSAVFPLAASLITKRKIEIANLDLSDPQGDKELFLLLQKGLPSGTIDVNGFIDGLPILAALACYANETTYLINAHPARFKESDRLLAMQTELQKMGAKLATTPDSMTIHPSPLHGASLFSHHDHRVAMALSIAALGASGPSTLSPTTCINKSFPNYLRLMQTLGYDCKHITPDSVWVSGGREDDGGEVHSCGAGCGAPGYG